MDVTSVLILMLITGALLLVANLGERLRPWRIMTYGMMAIAGGLTSLFGFLIVLAVAAQALLATEPMAPPFDEPARGLAIGLALGLAGLLSWLVLLGPVRRGLARIIPIRAESVVNAASLGLLLILGSLGGMGVLVMLDRGQLAEQVAQVGPLSLAYVVLNEAWLGMAAVLGVGFPVRRSFRETLARLGVQGLTPGQLLLTLAGVGGLLAFEVALQVAARQVSPQAYEELSRLTENLYAGLRTPLGAVAVGVASGTAEELLFRGAIQPRYGLVLTSLIFGAMHLQYGLSCALLSVVIVGLVLGIYRQRINTTSCMLIHGLYNMLLFLLPDL